MRKSIENMKERLKTKNARIVNELKTRKKEVFASEKVAEGLRNVSKNEVRFKALVAEELKEKTQCCQKMRK